MNYVGAWQSKDTIESMFNSLTDAVFSVDQSGRLLSTSPGFNSMLGYCMGEMQGRLFSEMVYCVEQGNPATASGGMHWFLHSNDKPVCIELVHKDGHTIPVTLQSMFLLDDSGRRTEAIGILEKLHPSQSSIDSPHQPQYDQGPDFLENVFHTTGDGILVTDACGMIIRVNAAVTKILGFSESELLGKNASSLALRNQATATDPSLIDRIYKDGFFENYETTWQRKDGSTCPVEMNISTLKDSRGTVSGGVAIVRDISERKAAEAALRRSEANLSSLVDNTKDFICSVDTESRILTLNRPFRALYKHFFGVELEAGMNMLDYMDDRQHDYWRDTHLRTLQGEHILLEQRFRQGDKEMFVETSTNPIRDADGKTIGVSYFIRDITERKRAEEERVRLQTAIEQADESIVITDSDGMIVYVNPSFVRTTGYSRKEAIGQHISFIRSGRHDKAFFDDMLDTITSGGVWKGHFLSKKKDGTYYDEESTISPVKNNKGEITHYVALMRDVTQEFVLEQQLRQAQKMEAIGKLAGGIAHDFNNILSAIIGFTEMTLYNCDNVQDVRGNMNQVLKAAERAEELVKQILTFSRRGGEHKKPIRLSAVMNDSMKLLRATIPSTIEIRHIAESDARVLADITQMQQLYMNLCTNAAYAMREKGGKLEVRLTEVLLDYEESMHYKDIQPGHYLKSTVRDNGTGIPLDILDRIFDPFFTTKDVGEGTGMGLAMVHGIVKQHGGAITVASTPGLGTTFTILLPRVEEVPEEETRIIETLPTGTERILFVDDEALLVQSNSSMLETLGYQVTAMKSSLDALAVFRGDPSRFDIVISDQTMPNLTGFELAREILRLRPDMPVILSTGYSDQVTPEKAQEVGIRAVVMKPVRRRDLAQKVRNVLDHSIPAD